MHDGITFEQHGKRAAVLCTEPFESTARNIAEILGLPDYAFIMVEHPIGSRTADEIKVLAEAAYAQAVPVLLEDDGD